jgi:glyoxylase-like metal-dependent hydrolase (beta-lactamase superfamily II)
VQQILDGIYWLLGQGMDSNVFIIESNGETLLIDSGLGERMSQMFGGQAQSMIQLEKAMKVKNIKQVLLTHGHLDHVGGIMSLQSKLNIKTIYASKIESQFLKAGTNSYISPFMGSECDPIPVSHELEEGSKIQIGTYSFQILYTPGHTSGSISLWEPNHKVLVSGDTVFPQGSFGRTDLPTGSSKELIVSLKRLSNLNVKVLLPGHMPPMISSSDSTAKSIQRSYHIAQEMFTYY